MVYTRSAYHVLGEQSNTQLRTQTSLFLYRRENVTIEYCATERPSLRSMVTLLTSLSLDEDQLASLKIEQSCV